jgi:hypothetical protein
MTRERPYLWTLGDLPTININVSVLQWATERYENTLNIAATKTGDDRAGWLEDAAYWREIVRVLKQATR